MKYIISVALLLFLTVSCSTVNLVSIEVREPADVTFPPEVKNVLIVDNTVSQKEEEPANGVAKDGIALISTDSTRTILLNSLHKFMGEEKYFDEVMLYPKRTNSGSGDEVKLLSTHKARSLCREKKADALISMDIFAVSAELESENVAYFGSYNILSSKLGTILRVYGQDGMLLSSPIVYVDSLFREEQLDWSRMRNRISEINSLVTEIAVRGADKLTSAFIPSWKTQERWFYSDSSKDMKNAANFLKEGRWQDAADIWGMLYEKEKGRDKKIKLASNIALANEYLDDIENASEWITIAYELLPSKTNNSDLAVQVMTYWSLLVERVKDKPKLYEQLGLENIDDDSE